MIAEGTQTCNTCVKQKHIGFTQVHGCDDECSNSCDRHLYVCCALAFVCLSAFARLLLILH
ncbi:Hypothetical protein UVM_LOCUS470 [uncultured virus]|nr:Hypothetical protein UVM_LOCUS470 [uncultured virus]